ncbi:MAG TPA: DUF374 domain-containing protein [Deltaproteobacteria bacterium]|nr:DUF374 domain-containing protein [Deltaproteobacteria bacterium]
MGRSLWKEVGRRALLALAPPVVYAMVRLLAATMRFEYVNLDEYRRRVAAGENAIYAFWHGRLLMMPLPYEGRGMTILVSRHRDGELISRFSRYFGVEAARGSTTRGGASGAKAMLRAARAGRDLAITPDGPKGPRYRVQPGVVQLAAWTGLPIIPAAFGASRKVVFSSWDAFMVPLPFSTGVYICGDPIYVDRRCTPQELERKRTELEESMRAITERADRYFDDTAAGGR